MCVQHVKHACISVTHTATHVSVCNNPYKLLGMCICGWAGGPPDHCVCVCVSCDVCAELAMFLFSPLPTGDLAYVSYCLLQSPYVLTLSFFLLPSLVSTLLPSHIHQGPSLGWETLGEAENWASLWNRWFPKVCFSIMGPGLGHSQVGVQRAVTVSGKSICFRVRQTWVQM